MISKSTKDDLKYIQRFTEEALKRYNEEVLKKLSKDATKSPVPKNAKDEYSLFNKTS